MSRLGLMNLVSTVSFHEGIDKPKGDSFQSITRVWHPNYCPIFYSSASDTMFPEYRPLFTRLEIRFWHKSFAEYISAPLPYLQIFLISV